MCTATWLITPNGYQLFFNRDELNTRLPAKPPSIRNHSGVKVIAPIDGDAQGSWICSNAYGLTLCLLNNYADAAMQTISTPVSRGQLLMDASHLVSQHQVMQQLKGTDLGVFRAFDLLVLAIGETPLLISWNGTNLTTETNPRMPLSSSSYDTANIVFGRKQQFRQMKQETAIDPDQLEWFHRSHLPTQGPGSVCMHRTDAQSVSYSHITADSETTYFFYKDGSPCGSGTETSVKLDRIRAETVSVA